MASQGKITIFSFKKVMFNIIETIEQIQLLSLEGNCFVHLIPFSYKYHPALQVSKISLIYIYHIDTKKSYILPIDHSESKSKISLKQSLDYLFYKFNRIFVLNKKDIIHYVGEENHVLLETYVDINVLFFKGRKVEYDYENNSCLKYFYLKYLDLFQINTIIPILKHFESLQNFIKEINLEKNQLSVHHTNNFFFINRMIKVFYNIEKEGINLSKNDFINHYNYIKNPEFNIKEGKIYTQYNLNTSSGRPSNSFNEINFGALSKNNKERICYKAENDYLLEIDFKAYHPRLLMNYLGIKLDLFYDKDIYEEFGKIYFNKENLLPGEINSSKRITFQQMYGNTNNAYIKEHVFFRHLKEFTEHVWSLYSQNINIEINDGDLILNSILYPNLNKNQINNYVVCALETTRNVKIMDIIQNFLVGKQKTKLILYNYDSFLFDVDKKETEILELIKIILTADNLFPIRIKQGITYGF